MKQIRNHSKIASSDGSNNPESFLPSKSYFHRPVLSLLKQDHYASICWFLWKETILYDFVNVTFFTVNIQTTQTYMYQLYNKIRGTIISATLELFQIQIPCLNITLLQHLDFHWMYWHVAVAEVSFWRSQLLNNYRLILPALLVVSLH